MSRNKKAPGNFDRRGQGWRWRVCIGGRRHAFLIKVTDRRDAETWARKKFDELGRMQDRAADGLPVGVTFTDLLGHFERERLPLVAKGTADAYQDSLKPIRAYFVEELRVGDIPIERIRRAHVVGFLTWRRAHRLDGEDPVSNRTLAKDRAVLHRMFEVALEQEWIDANPVAKVEKPKGDARQPVIITADQYEAFLAALTDQQVRLYALLCGETGCRCESEALWLRWEDVDLEGGFVTIVSGRDGHRTKGGRSRSVPLTARLRDALRSYFAAHRFAAYGDRRPEYVFHHTRTRRHHRAGDRVRSFRQGIVAAAAAAKLPDAWVMHDLRHRRITTWLAEGRSPVLVKEAVGHADLRTTMGYTHLAKEHLRALVEPVAIAGHKLDTAAAQ